MEEILATGAKGGNALAAILFLASVNMTLQAYGTLNSSPWTAESFGADDRRAAAMREYVYHAVALSLVVAVISACVAQGKAATFGIMAGAIATNVYLVFLYWRASARGLEAGSSNWVIPGNQ